MYHFHLDNILMVIIHSIDYLLIMFIMIPVFSQSFSQSFIVSSSLANQIKSHLYTIPTTSICGSPLVIQNDNDCFKLNQSGWSSIVVNEGLCNSLTESISISNNTCLQYIYIQAGSLKSMNSLSISSLPELEWFITEDNSFYSTTSLTLSSIF